VRRLLLVLLLVLLPRPASASSWVAPLAGPLVLDRGFDPPATAYGTGHRGVDLRGTTGQSVLTAGAGRVSYAGLLAGRGVVTVVHAGGLRTTYEPLTATVRVGQLVGVGQPIGTLGGGHCRDGGPCLHWGLLRRATYLDPMSLLGVTGVRLLPLDGAGGSAAEGSAPGGSAAGGSGAGGSAASGSGAGGSAAGDSTAGGSTAGGSAAGGSASGGSAAGGSAATGRAGALSLPRGPVSGQPVEGPVQAAPPPAPRLVLRAADRVSGAAAVLLLGLGLIMLVRRPGPPPRHPAAPAAAALSGETARTGSQAPVDLEVERSRRRTG